jgi:hypothetical protein
MSCPICEKRPSKRYCPAKGETICAICCGREREVTIDCPLDCSYLAAAHRYEAEHRKPPSAEEYPYKTVEFSVDFVYQRWPLIAGIATTILTFHSLHKDLRDSEVFTALERLAETYRTLGTGIYYERPPEAPVPLALYGELQRFLHDFRKAGAQQGGFTAVKDSDVFQLLVFLLRMNRSETNGRPRSRAFIAFLRARFPLQGNGVGGPTVDADAPRIIIP